MKNEQQKFVGTGTEICGVRTSVNKEYWKRKAASNSSCIFLERDPCLRRTTNSCNRSGQVKQTVTFHVVSRSIRSLKSIFYWSQPFLDGVGKKKKLGIYSEHCVNKLEATWIEIIKWRLLHMQFLRKIVYTRNISNFLPLDKHLVHRMENVKRFIIVIV